MQKVIRGGAHAALLFPFLYEGFLAGARQATAESRTPEVKRLERELLRAMKAVSKEDEELLAPNIRKRVLVNAEIDPVLRISVQAHALLVKYLEATPWNPWIVDTAMDAADWVLGAAQE